jgi:outer membrane protein TolC
MATGAREAIRFEVRGGPLDVEGPDPDTLPLFQAVRDALVHDPRVQSALARVHVARADAHQSRLLPNPLLTVALRFPEGGGSLQVDAGLSADLIALFRRPSQVSAADHRVRAAAAEAVTTALDVVAEVQEAYAEAQSAEAQLAVLDEQVRLNARLLQLARDRLEAGESARLDVLTLDADRIEWEAARLRKQADASDHRLVLARLIGRPSHDCRWKIDAGPGVTSPLVVGGDRERERRWIETALMHRPELQARSWELAALGDELASARLLAFDAADLGVDAERDEAGWSLGPAVSTPLPLFDWGQARRAKAEAQRIDARHQATLARRQVVEEVRRAMARLSSAQAAVSKVEAELLPVQQRRQQQAEQSYRAGLTDITALLASEKDLQASRATWVELQKEATLARVRLDRAVGGSGVVASLGCASSTAPSTRPTTVPAGVP